MKITSKLTYKKSGVNYKLLDPVKKLAQTQGLLTSNNLTQSGFSELSESRGESAYVIENKDCYFAVVQEGLGTKNLIADEMEKITGKTCYESIAQDTVAMIINDLITVGARPMTLLAYWAVGDSNWFDNSSRSNALVTGWRHACDAAGCSWGGGETPTLKNVVYPDTIDLAGSAFGIVEPKDRLITGDKIMENDVVLLFESSGIHANGLTLVRKLSEKLPEGLNTKLSDGKTFGQEVLTPTIIYSKLVNEILDKGIDIHYLVNITGHGWRKLMRAKQSYSYVIEKLPVKVSLFDFIQNKARMSDKEMYATFNMGAGFALITGKQYTQDIIRLAQKYHIKAWVGGVVQKGQKQVIIEPLNITYKETDLDIR
jgi:phosphoribosylformylglycinamidine cyclo-ligase